MTTRPSKTNLRRGEADTPPPPATYYPLFLLAAFLAVGALLLALGFAGHEENGATGHSRHGHDHEQHHGPQAGSELIVTTEPTEPTAGRPVTLRLMIHAADGRMVKDYEVMHGEKVHLVIVRDGLDHFAHLHPTADEKGNLTVTHTFPAGGRYRLYADYTPAGGWHATATGSLSVGGESPPAPLLRPDAPGEVEGDGLRAAVSAATLAAGSPARVSFALRDEGSRPARLEPFMGELGHLMFVGAGNGRYIHVHPVGGDAARGTVEFEAHFPEPGIYKGWGQFEQGGRVRVVPLAVEVK